MDTRIDIYMSPHLISMEITVIAINTVDMMSSSLGCIYSIRKYYGNGRFNTRRISQLIRAVISHKNP